MIAEIEQMPETIKAGLVCGLGGHYTQMKLLEKAFEGLDYFYITVDSIASREEEKAYLFRNLSIKRSVDYIKLMYYLYIFLKSFFILLKERPSVLVSTGGSGMTPPVFYAARMLGIKLILIEPHTRFTSKSLAGKTVSPITDRIFVQNPELLQAYRGKAEYWGGF
ncbi:MAG: PssD/Cps14F family polysaccharide biosynthesis glycosyltransferase [Dehalococcoidia bacterium]